MMKRIDKIIIGILLLCGIGGYLYYQSHEKAREAEEATIARDKRNWQKNVDACVRDGKGQQFCECTITEVQKVGTTAELKKRSRAELDEISREASRYCRREEQLTMLEAMKKELKKDCQEKGLNDRACDCLMDEMESVAKRLIEGRSSERELTKAIRDFESSPKVLACFAL